MVRVTLPAHLRTLGSVDGEVVLSIGGPVTIAAVLEALEAAYPALRGTIREHVTKKRRGMVRFFVCGEDISLMPPDTVLPDAIISGAEPFMVIAAIAGG